MSGLPHEGCHFGLGESVLWLFAVVEVGAGGGLRCEEGGAFGGGGGGALVEIVCEFEGGVFLGGEDAVGGAAAGGGGGRRAGLDAGLGEEAAATVVAHRRIKVVIK